MRCTLRANREMVESVIKIERMTTVLQYGLYEQIINKQLYDELAEIPSNRKKTVAIDKAESSRVLAQYVGEIVQKGLDNVVDNGGNISEQVALINQIINVIEENTGEADFASMNVAQNAEQLLAILREKDPMLVVGKTANELIRPETSMAQSSLFTGAIHEPQMYSELRKEILSADRIDMLVSFVKWSGLRLIFEELKDFTKAGGELRIITTSYMGATEIKAIEEMRRLPNTKIKVSYDTKCTRLHAKSYMFYRNTGFTTAYIGSSNLSSAAMSSGLEWNVKLTKKDLPETIKKIEATFEVYWNSKDFEYYTEEKCERLAYALKAEKYYDGNNPEMYTADITPYSYQKEILDKLDAERKVHGYNRNLVVAATGTGKTIISALDYKRFCKEHSDKPCRLLFVAHREEILDQSLYTFRQVLKDANFGEKYVGGSKVDSIDYLFVSIQTFNSKDLISITKPEFFDYIIVDEFHHAKAQSYQKLLGYYQPQILLGLTATPERMDGKNILEYFNNRIAAEIRLPEAIDRKLLCPFHYFGVTDEIDLSSVKWSAGGYDKTALSNLYTFDSVVANKRADLVINSLLKYVADINAVKGLGFCVSVEHAKFMSTYFNNHNIPSIFLTGQSTDEERKTAKKRLVSGKIRFIFVVDLYNEGVDIPEVNTVLFLRPTESLTVFLQQLGRGLRLSEGKDCLTVLDFIGQAHKKYSFENKFKALLKNTTKGIEREIKDGFISVPKGCYIQLEKVAKEYILKNIRNSYNNTNVLVNRVATFEEDSGKQLTMKNFLDHYHLDPRVIYKYATFSRICVSANVRPNFNEPLEGTLQKAFGRLSVINSRRWIDFLLKILPEIKKTNLNELSDIQKRMLQMFYVTVWQKTVDSWENEEVLKHFELLASSPVLLEELMDLLKYQYEKIDFIDIPVDVGFDCPLDLHCTYTRDQLLVALDFMKPDTVREGAKWLPEKNLDVFFITLNKSDKDYSPTTMYDDYSINESLFHWQSQSTISENSPTGKRYINHRNQGTQVLLFVREYKKDYISGGAEAYTYLGTANYVSHKGSKPMSIIWYLDCPLPAKYLKKTNKLVVG